MLKYSKSHHSQKSKLLYFICLIDYFHYITYTASCKSKGKYNLQKFQNIEFIFIFLTSDDIIIELCNFIEFFNFSRMKPIL